MLEINKIYNGDCLEVMKDIDDNSIDLVITSPPYDKLRDYKGYIFDFENIALELYRILKIGGTIVWVVNDAMENGSETLTSFKQAIYFKDTVGFNIHDTMIWEKPYFANPSTNRYHQTFEYVFILTKGKQRIFNPIRDRQNKWAGYTSFGVSSVRNKEGALIQRKKKPIAQYGTRTNVWKIPTSSQENPCKNINHPATFSKTLVHDHIISWSNEGDLILDPMCGSGTTCIVAKELNRNYLGIDISEEYCIDARKSLELTFPQTSLNI